ncbi:hypothetical protein M758_6G047700 [Ceratodon purpureus]|nr:hypothetical protein M758_6G047700 [Ceratodon purpureus]
MRQIRTEVLTIATMRWWCLVQVGEERMLYLLSYAAIFVPLPNYCLLQVAGHSFSMATSNTKQIPKTISTTRKSQYELPTVLQQEDPTNEQNTSFETNMKTRLTDVGPCDEVSGGVTRSGKRVRPSSWVRRKQRRLQGTHVVSKRSVSIIDGLDTIDPTMISPCIVNKVEVPKPVHRVGLPPRFIDRSAIFYHSTFSCHAGLPANHILNTSNANEADISRLLGSMFKALDGVDTTSGEASTSTAGKVAKDELIKNMKGLLRKMVRNAKHCNYARLLSRHCPLPSNLASPLPKVKTSVKQAKKQVKSSSGLSLLKEAYATQEIEVNLPPAAANSESVDFKNMTTRKQHCKQGTYKRVSSLSSEVHADINPQGSSKKICNMARSSNPQNAGPRGGSSFGKLVHVENFRKPSVVDEILHEKDTDAGPTPDLAKLVTLSTSHSQVVNFLWAVCRSLLPEEFLGSERFRRILCSGIASFVSLRRHETFHVQHLLNKLQISISAWPEFKESGQKYQNDSPEESNLSVARTKTKKRGCPSYIWGLPQTMLLDWLYWLFSEIIIPLLRSHFYVTEAENHRQNVLYYRKPVWAKIHMLSLNHLVAKYYTRLDPVTVAELLQKRVLGFSHIRMLPKHSGVRPIANLSSRTRCTLPLIIGGPNVRESSALIGKRHPCSLHESMDEVDFRPSTHGRKISREVKFAFKSINSRLRGVHTCLKYEQENHPEDFGASVFGYKDAYVKFLPYVMHLKSLPGGLPPIYMAVCDISRAYDTIKQDKLCEVVSGFLRLPVYNIRRYVTIFNTMSSARACYKQTCITSDQERDILSFFMDLAARRSHSILQDQGVVTRVKQGHILGLIEEHVKRNIVKIGPHFYLQKSGIAQGSVLSPLLCSVFFGHLDEHILMPLLQHIPQPDASLNYELSREREGKSDTLEVAKVLENDDTILLRLIDDSLFISTSRSAVTRFVQLMHDGFEEYGCHANRSKTAVSFDLLLNHNQVKKAQGVYMTNDGASFMRWSGLLINCCTLEVQADYTRYIGESIKGSITVVRKTNPGAQVPIKLCHFVRPKCHPMLYDLRINSPSTIRLNAYQAFLLCAMKFHAYLCSMERTCCHHPPFLLKAIDVTSSYMHGLLRKQMQEMGDGLHLGVTKEEMTWLALHAFLKVLNKKQSRYVELLFLIQETLDMPKYRFLSQCPHLASARDENRSTMFKFIIY